MAIFISGRFRVMSAEPPLDERSERILEATEILIGERGYDRVRFIDVAEAAGVSIGSLQHRFRNREGLLRAALERSDSRERNRWLDLTKGIDEPWERLMALIQNVLSMSRNVQVDHLFLQLLAVAQRDPSLQEILQSQQDRWALTFTQVIAEGMASGRMTSDLTAEEAGMALLALTDGFYLARNIGNRPPDPPTISRIAEIVAQRVIQRHDI
jgi:AcrR family transcriptional regulator